MDETRRFSSHALEDVVHEGVHHRQIALSRYTLLQHTEEEEGVALVAMAFLLLGANAASLLTLRDFLGLVLQTALVT